MLELQIPRMDAAVHEATGFTLALIEPHVGTSSARPLNEVYQKY